MPRILTPFSCCTCPKPPGYDSEVDDPMPKYGHICGCPTATFSCVSAEKNTQLCGFKEFIDSKQSPPIELSVPPKAYLRKETTVESLLYRGWDCCADNYSLPMWERDYSTTPIFATMLNRGLFFTEYSSEYRMCPIKSSGETKAAYTLNSCGSNGYTRYQNLVVLEFDDPEKSNTLNFFTNGHPWDGDYVWGADSQISAFYKTGECYPVNSQRCDYEAVFYEGWLHRTTLSLQDTEADALARTTATEGTECTSRYDYRTDSLYFMVRTVKFSIELNDLCYGRAYEGCARIRKRRTYSGTKPDDPVTGEPEVIEWEDVDPFTFGPITPSADNTTDGVTTTAEITDQDLVGGTEDAIGWEYKIESAHVWPVSAECDYPTELGYTDSE